MAENKIKYGISKAYYAVATVGADGAITYGAPVALRGAVSLSLDAQGDITKFYADNIVYYQSAANNGYEGDLEISNIPESFAEDVLGEVMGDDNMLGEYSNVDGKAFAFLVQFEGDQKATRHVFYNCTATRPSIASTTVADGGKEPQTDSLTISAAPREDGLVKYRTTAATEQTLYDGFFTTVYLPTVTPATTQED